MVDNSKVISGVDRAHGSSVVQKLAFFCLHVLSLVLCVWLVFGGGIETVGHWFGRSWSVVDHGRVQVMLGVIALYVVRHSITLFYLLRRRITWSEALSLGGFMIPLEIGFTLLAAGVAADEPAPFGVLDVAALSLVLIGSYLNTGSEVQRKHWKARSENKGKCYTGGRFKHSMHINYFGDSVAFTGWAILTATWWTFLLPLLMTAMFIFMHIPGLDLYLAERYGEPFKEYAARTKKFMPFVY